MTAVATAPTGVSPHPARELAPYVGESNLMRSVRSLHAAVGHPVAGGPAGLGPDVIAPERLELRLTLIAEEFCEVVGSIMGPEAEKAMAAAWATTMAAWDRTYVPDVAHVAKEMADLAVVLGGTAVETAIPLDASVAEVHASNMTKLDKDGNVLKRADDKVFKSELYREPNMHAVLAAHVVPGPYTREQISEFWAAIPGRTQNEHDGIAILASDLRLAVDTHDVAFASEAAYASPVDRRTPFRVLNDAIKTCQEYGYRKFSLNAMNRSS